METELGIRCKEIRLAAAEDPRADHVRHRVVCLVDKSPDEDDHQDQHPCFACQGRLHVQGRRLVLERKLE